MNTPLRLVLLPLTLACVTAMVPRLQAVSPPPDGGYAGGNTAEGTFALLSLSSGGYNTAIGLYSLLNNTTAAFNTGIGAGTLFSNITTEQNTATGAGALFSHTAGNGNTAHGAFALFNDIGGQLNTAVGADALFTNSTGSFNTAAGQGALFNNTGDDNTALGAGALASNTTGSDNTAIGVSVLPNNTTGNNNIAIGPFAGQAVSTANHVICIGDQGANIDNSCYISQIFGFTATGGSAVFIDANNKLGTISSSRRFKTDIKPMAKISEALFSLKPVTFRYKKEIDPVEASQLGLIAEEVEKVDPDLIVRDKAGKPYSVRYDQVNAMLLNEFLKDHRKVEEQESTIAELRSSIAQQEKAFTSKLAEQDKRIKALTSGLQKVNAQMETTKPNAQLFTNNP